MVDFKEGKEKGVEWEMLSQSLGKRFIDTLTLHHTGEFETTETNQSIYF